MRLALVTLIGFASASYAQVCHSPIVHHAYPVTPVVVKKVVTPVFFAVPIPVYGAVYTPPVPTPASGGDELKQVAEALKAIDARLKTLEKPAAQATPAPSNPFQPNAGGNPLGVVQAKCAACHEASASAEKGGGLTLIENGVLARLTPGQALKVISTSYRGSMPPKSSGLSLSDEETSLLVTHYGGK